MKKEEEEEPTMQNQNQNQNSEPAAATTTTTEPKSPPPKRNKTVLVLLGATDDQQSEIKETTESQAGPILSSLDAHHQCGDAAQDQMSPDKAVKSVAGNVDKAGGVLEEEEEEISGRDRLKRHRGEVAGQVWIPDIWGQEDLLKDWIDCSAALDAALVPQGIISARSALVQEARIRANSGIYIYIY
ncbi:hypothetical protein Dimus_034750 [Dionaea muscipula]